MTLVERATIIHYHRHRIDCFGVGQVRSLGWRDAASQRKRFDAIAGAFEFDRCSVLDLGCGCGDLKAFLAARFKDVDYLGIDQMPEFIDFARKRYAGDPRARFHLDDFAKVELPRVDVVVASGALGYRCAEAGFHLRMIERMVATAAKAVIFNVLDDSTFPDHPLLVGRDLEEVTAFCRSLSANVEQIGNYLRDDLTFVVRAGELAERKDRTAGCLAGRAGLRAIPGEALTVCVPT